MLLIVTTAVTAVAAEVAAYLPTGQFLHAPPVVSWYLPASQSVHVLDGDAVDANLPLRQPSQAVLMPDAALNVPVGQLSHAVLKPEAALNVPEGQFLHAPPVVSWYLPASQSVHVLDGDASDA